MFYFQGNRFTISSVKPIQFPNCIYQYIFRNNQVIAWINLQNCNFIIYYSFKIKLQNSFRYISKHLFSNNCIFIASKLDPCRLQSISQSLQSLRHFWDFPSAQFTDDFLFSTRLLLHFAVARKSISLLPCRISCYLLCIVMIRCLAAWLPGCHCPTLTNVACITARRRGTMRPRDAAKLVSNVPPIQFSILFDFQFILFSSSTPWKQFQLSLTYFALLAAAVVWMHCAKKNSSLRV